MPTIQLSVLDTARVAKPCSMRWEDMAGDDRVRRCESCNLNVYNFASLTRDEAENLLLKAQGRVCGLLFRRADGTIITRDCPVGLRAARLKTQRAAARLVAAIGFLVTGSMLWAGRQRDPWQTARLRQMQPFSTVCAWLSNTPPVQQQFRVCPGEMAWTPPIRQAPPPPNAP